MKKTKLYRVREAGEINSHLTDNPDGNYVESERVKLEELDSYEIADYLDQQAENENRHDFVGVHSRLAKLIRVQATDIDADVVMLEVLKAGGLWRLAK